MSAYEYMTWQSDWLSKVLDAWDLIVPFLCSLVAIPYFERTRRHDDAS